MNAIQVHGLCDAILGCASQVNDICETIGALLALYVEFSGRLDPESQRYAKDYALELTNAIRRAEQLEQALRQVAALRQDLEQSHAALHRVRVNRAVVDDGK